ncbi:MAG: type II toxin-antitoxin system VapC family toxin [Actinomycetota bacterium]
MITYADSSILLARYLVEDRSDEASGLMRQATLVATSRVAEVEVRRGLSFVDSPVERTMSQSLFAQEWRALAVVEMDAALADLAATIAADTRVRSLDAIHVASALVVGAQRFVTFDQRQAPAARRFDLAVVGVPA